MSGLLEYIRVTTNKLNREVDTLDSLRYVMLVLKEIRERETTIEMEIAPTLDMYRLLEAYVPGTLVDKDEMDQKSIIRNNWRKLVEFAETITDNLNSVQVRYVGVLA
jgi:dynein heavy chain